MTSALIIGDPHFKIDNVIRTDMMVEALKRVVIEKKPTFIVVLGDILDRHETIHVSPLTRSVKFLSEMSELAPTFALIGNHDLKNNRQFLSDEHPFTAVKKWSNITIADKTLTTLINGQRFTFVPYVPPGRFEEALNTVDNWRESSCIFAHQEFNGCKMGAIISVEGDKWPVDYPYVVTGHIHDYQELQSNILYTGTPIQHAFGDGTDKSVMFITFNSSSERNCERIDLQVLRKKIVHITCSEIASLTLPTNCELKIVITGTSGEIKAAMKNPIISEWKKTGIKIVYKDIPIDKELGIVPTASTAPLRFTEVLFQSINENPALRKQYNKIFGLNVHV